ncbi:Dilute domain-containing protein C25B8.08 [Choanephora cucurbitarum]|uniref:Dilute domain-containing protein C25B8.08 n=1 Tax=Choanephora cucurbitarum TaxID=101091 RepID=A0A1C7NJ23_9FUNG|nr:Dilute domain-containing protein C25B8.08 [Choanephora cucurbitarum]
MNTNTHEPEVADQEALRKQYENMSYDEMSKRIAESYKQLSEILGDRINLPADNDISSSTNSSSDSLNDFEPEDKTTIVNNTELSEEQKKLRLNKLFMKAVSSGDVEKLNEYLNEELIDIDGQDEDGTTALIYAACFGKHEIAQALIVAGAKINSQDARGWTPLMWATTNGHEKIVKLLLENGASAQTKSAKGRTVFDLVKNDTNKMADILVSNVNPRSSVSSVSSSLLGSISSSTSSHAGDGDRYYQYSTEENYEHFMTQDQEARPKLIEEFLMQTYHSDNEDEGIPSDDEFNDINDDDDEEEDEEAKEIEFNWERCMPDQMFVFAADDLSHILDTVITKLTLPVRNVQEIFLPANVVFLSARFAHYFSSAELAEEVLEGALKRISDCVKSNTKNVHILSYWMTNITRLLYYLKKDVGLMVATARYQLELSELVSETYNYMVVDTGNRITQVLEPAMLEYEPITGIMDEINFADDWQRFFRRSMSNRPSEDIQRSSSGSTMEASHAVISPKTITQLLSSTYYVFQSYEVHSTIIIQALAQFFHLLSCELFNCMLSKKKYLCRSKAVQVRMNLSSIEDWIRQNHLPSSLIAYLQPSIQLTQLLQCMSQLNTVASFQSTVKFFDAINPLQIRRCVMNYRYETQEPRLPDEVERYVKACVEETRTKQASRQSRTFERRKSTTTPPSMRRSLSGLDSPTMSSFMGIFNTAPPSSPNRPASIEFMRQESARSSKRMSNLSSQQQFNSEVESSQEQAEDFDEHETEKIYSKEEVNETKDSRFMLPFFVPTTAQLSHQTAIHGKQLSSLMPAIPEDWMDKLDKSEKSN